MSAAVQYLFLFQFLISGWSSLPTTVDAALIVPTLLGRSFQFSRVREADVNLGLLSSVHKLTGDGRCDSFRQIGALRAWTFEFAIDQVNDRTDLLPNVTLGFVEMDDCFDALKALEVSVYFVEDNCDSGNNSCVGSVGDDSDDVRFRSYDVAGVVGPSTSGISVVVAPFLGTLQVPVMGLYATANALSDKSQYPYFVRLVPPDLGQERMLIQVIRLMNWTYVSLVISPDAYGDGASSDVQTLLRTNPDYGICLAMIVRIPSSPTAADYNSVVDTLAANDQARAVLLYVSQTNQPGFFQAVRLRVGYGRFVFIGGDALSDNANLPFADMLVGSVFTNLPSAPVPGLQQYIWSLQYGSGPNQINDEWFGELWRYQFPCTGNSSCGTQQSLNQSQVPFTWSWPSMSRTYDGVFVYATALHNAISDICPEALSKSPQQAATLKRCLRGDIVLKYLKNTTLSGVIGNIRFDANGDMIGAVELYQYRNISNNGTASYVTVLVGRSENTGDSTPSVNLYNLDWTAFGENNSSETTKPESNCGRPCLVGEYAIQLPVVCCWRCEKCPHDGNLTRLGVQIRYSRCEPSPPMVPSCGSGAELCPRTIGVIVGCIVASVFLLILLMVAMVMRSKRAEAKVRQMLWKVDYADIVFFNPGLYGASMMLSSATMKSLTSRSDPNTPGHGTCPGHGTWQGTAVYKGRTVSVTYVGKRVLNLSRRDLVELSNLKELSQDNIQSFIGACIEPGNVCYLMQNCNRRTVQDIINDENIKLDWLFRQSLINDLTNGMIYLHKSVFQSHGHLTSAVCHVDSRWVLKIGGFGLRAFRDENDISEVGEYAFYRDLLWTAPELLRLMQRPNNGTQKGDVYSFAIIVQEIAYRAQPYFCNEISSPKVIVERVRTVETPAAYRPVQNFDNSDISFTLQLMMQQCWAEQPIVRPSFEDIARVIKRTNKGKKIDIVDNMLQRLEKYADNLEYLVQQRTAELEDEKRKTENLLYRMLPQLVADELKAGRKVRPQMYAEATIYFSDIVGFTTLSSQSTPLEVVDLLNDLYNTFDDAISRHDVYKVETIGDAYMVVSGLPMPNEGRHIVEICNMALDLLCEVPRFKIRHRPTETLMLRIGIHTGPCAAGVVGHAMPRYCLFGDTVNVASRMESTGEALRIHMSHDALEALKQFPGFKTEARGQTYVKGKGMLSTYWLNSNSST